MKINQSRVFRTGLSWLGRNALASGAFWLIGLGLVQLGERALGGWPASEAGQLIACISGVVIALALRARTAAYLIAAFAAFTAAELAIHLSYGVRAAQGAPTHFAVMAAGVTGVVLGGLLASGGGATRLGSDVRFVR